MMTHIFDDITITDRGISISYQGHLVQTNEAVHNGFATAAMVAVWMMGTEEGDKRGIGMLETREERAELMRHYEHETLREDGGLMLREVEALYWWLWRFEHHTDNAPQELPPLSMRQAEMWETLVQEYMCSKIETWGKLVLQAEDNVDESDTYLDWLISQLCAYTRMRYMRKTQWLDYQQMESLWAMLEANEGWMGEGLYPHEVITHLPADVKAETLIARYFELREKEHAERIHRPTAAAWYEAEKQALSEANILEGFAPTQLQELADYHKQWLRYLSKRLKIVSAYFAIVSNVSKPKDTTPRDHVRIT